MATKHKPLTSEEFVSLLLVGNTYAVLEAPALIPAEHSARLIGLGYMVDLAGRLRSPADIGLQPVFQISPLRISIRPLRVETRRRRPLADSRQATKG
jgi:hypothetical protein